MCPWGILHHRIFSNKRCFFCSKYLLNIIAFIKYYVNKSRARKKIFFVAFFAEKLKIFQLNSFNYLFICRYIKINIKTIKTGKKQDKHTIFSTFYTYLPHNSSNFCPLKVKLLQLTRVAPNLISPRSFRWLTTLTCRKRVWAYRRRSGNEILAVWREKIKIKHNSALTSNARSRTTYPSSVFHIHTLFGFAFFNMPQK